MFLHTHTHTHTYICPLTYLHSKLAKKEK